MVTMYTIRPETTFAADNIRLRSCGQKCECIAASCTQKGPWYHPKAATHENSTVVVTICADETSTVPTIIFGISFLPEAIHHCFPGDIFGNSSLYRIIYHCFPRLIFLAFHSYLELFIIASLGQYFWHFIATEGYFSFLPLVQNTLTFNNITLRNMSNSKIKVVHIPKLEDSLTDMLIKALHCITHQKLVRSLKLHL